MKSSNNNLLLYRRDHNCKIPLFYAVRDCKICKIYRLSEKMNRKKDVYLDVSTLLRYGHIKTVYFLIRKFNKYLRYLPSYSRTIQLFMSNKRHLNLLHESMKVRKYSHKDIYLDELIIFGIKKKVNDAVMYLLNVHSNVHKLMTYNSTFIHYATYYNNYKITEYLLEKFNVTPNVCNTYYQFPLGNAFKHKNKKLIDLLLSYNANTFFLSFKIEETLLFGHHALIKKLLYSLVIEHLIEAKSIINRLGMDQNEIQSILFPVEETLEKHINMDTIYHIYSFLY